MSSSFYNSINPSTALLSRTQFPSLLAKDSSVEFFQFLRHHHRCYSYFRNRENGYFKKIKRAKAKIGEAPKWNVSASLAESVDAKVEVANSKSPQKKLKILVAGGGIGGLVFALAAKRKGFEVLVFEKDLSAIRGEGQYRGPIQIQSNALAALEAIDMNVAEEIMSACCITGDRINGLVDGISGNWYIKFDTFTPAVESGLPVTRVISRLTLQQILACSVGEETIMNESNVVDFEDDGNKVTVILENGQRHEGDLLVGADGIWSKVRTNLFGYSEAIYSEYTCYTGIADFVPADIDTVGYRVFLGHKQYFVSSDVGGGKMQWYAFHKEPPGGVDGPNGKKERLLKLFGGWCENVIDLLVATDEDAILRRDIYDRTPSFSWGKGRVTLLGDSIHAMQPNMGQGGCMAIEDSYQLALELDKAWRQSIQSGSPIDVLSSLRSYENARRVRVSVIHGLARMAAIMATTYKPYLGVGLGPLSFLTKFRIPHPGRVGGRIFIDIGMPLMLSWVLGGYGFEEKHTSKKQLLNILKSLEDATSIFCESFSISETFLSISPIGNGCVGIPKNLYDSSKLEGRPLQCRLSDKANDELRKWLADDDALERALNAEWFLFPIGQVSSDSEAIFLSRDEKMPITIGSSAHADVTGVSIAISSPQVSKLHAEISYKDGLFYLTDLMSEYGTWIIDNEGRRNQLPPNSPARFRSSDTIEFGSDQAAFRVKVIKNLPLLMAKKPEKEILSAV